MKNISDLLLGHRTARNSTVVPSTLVDPALMEWWSLHIWLPIKERIYRVLDKLAPYRKRLGEIHFCLLQWPKREGKP